MDRSARSAFLAPKHHSSLLYHFPLRLEAEALGICKPALALTAALRPQMEASAVALATWGSEAGGVAAGLLATLWAETSLANGHLIRGAPGGIPDSLGCGETVVLVAEGGESQAQPNPAKRAMRQEQRGLWATAALTKVCSQCP